MILINHGDAHRDRIFVDNLVDDQHPRRSVDDVAGFCGARPQ